MCVYTLQTDNEMTGTVIEVIGKTLCLQWFESAFTKTQIQTQLILSDL